MFRGLCLRLKRDGQSSGTFRDAFILLQQNKSNNETAGFELA